MGKKYYIAIEYYDAEGKRISQRVFISGHVLGFLYSFTLDVNNAKFFNTLKSAKNYMKNYIVPSRAKVFYEIMYDIV